MSTQDEGRSLLSRRMKTNRPTQPGDRGNRQMSRRFGLTWGDDPDRTGAAIICRRPPHRRRWGIRMKALVGGSLVALGMATFAEPAPRLDGVYATPNEIAGYFGEVLRLEAGGFEYWSYSDVVKDSEPKYPIRGTFQIHGDEILLITEETIPAHRYCLTFRDTQMLLRTDALQIWKRDRKLYPYGCLIRTHLSPEQIATTNRPSIAIFGAENIAEWH